MTVWNRCALGLGILTLLSMGWQITVAQTPANPPQAEAPMRQRPLPANYGRLALSDDQKKQAYAVLNEYQARIDELQQQVRKLLEEREAKLQGVLTEAQKARLQELQAEARQRAAQRGNNSPRPTTPPAQE
jgi:TolA-binding protein